MRSSSIPKRVLMSWLYSLSGQTKSEQMKKNRGKLRVVHTSGSQSFQEIKSAMRSSLGRPPTMMEFWDRVHTSKGSTSGSAMSPAALAIRKRFEKLRSQCIAELKVARGDAETLDSTVPPPEISLSQDEETTLWVASQDTPTSTTGQYRVLGLPRIPAYTLPGGSSQRLRLRAPVGPSHTGTGLDDALFQRVMAAVSKTFETDPFFHRRDPPSRSRLHQLAQDVAAGATAESTGIPPVQWAAIRDEIVRMVVTLVEDTFGPMLSQGSTAQGDERTDE